MTYETTPQSVAKRLELPQNVNNIYQLDGLEKNIQVYRSLRDELVDLAKKHPVATEQATQAEQTVQAAEVKYFNALQKLMDSRDITGSALETLRLRNELVQRALEWNKNNTAEFNRFDIATVVNQDYVGSQMRSIKAQNPTKMGDKVELKEVIKGLRTILEAAGAGKYQDQIQELTTRLGSIDTKLSPKPTKKAVQGGLKKLENAMKQARGNPTLEAKLLKQVTQAITKLKKHKDEFEIELSQLQAWKSALESA